MTVAVGIELGGASGLGIGSELGAGSGLGAGTGLRTGSVLAAEPAAGATAGIGVGAGRDTSFGRAMAAFETAGSNGTSPSGPAASTADRSLRGTSLNAAAWSEAPIAGQESFKANWQPVLRAWGGPARPSGEALEETAGEPAQADAANGSGAGLSAGSVGSARVFSAREATQSPLAASGKYGSKANGAVPARNAPETNQSATNGQKVVAGAGSAGARSATKSPGSVGSSPVSSKIAKRNSTAQNAGAPAQPSQGVNGAAGLPVDAAVLAAPVTPLQANIPLARGIQSPAPSPVNARIDDTRNSDRMDDQTSTGEEPAPGLSVAVNEAKGAVSTTPASAVSYSTVSARAASQIPIHAAQNSPGKRAMNAGSAAAVEAPDRGRDEAQDDSALPQSTLTAGVMATSTSPKTVGAMETGTTAGTDEQKTAVAGLAAHRGVRETSGTSGAPATASSGGDKPDVEIASPQTPLAKTTHEAAAGGASVVVSQQTAARVIAAQSSGLESPAIVRDPAGAHGLEPSAIPTGSGSLGTPAAQETFAALDAGTTVGAPSWVHAGGRQAEAGFEDPALGWIGVRADLSGGSVHAALVTGSTETAQALSGHLEGLSAYLSEQHTPVATLTMAAPGNGGIAAGPDQSSGQGMEQSAGQQGEQNQAPAIEMGSQPGAGASSPATSSAVPASQFDAMAYGREGRGTHISVMA